MISLYTITVLLFTPIVMAYAIQYFVVIPRFKKELFEVNARRAESVREALASASVLAWVLPNSEPQYPFTGWVTLNPDGTLSIAGQTLSAAEVFEVTTKDKNQIPRAR